MLLVDCLLSVAYEAADSDPGLQRIRIEKEVFQVVIAASAYGRIVSYNLVDPSEVKDLFPGEPFTRPSTRHIRN